MIKRFVRNESGATAIEYSLLIAVICLAIVTALTQLSGSVQLLFGNAASQVKDAVN